MEVAAVYLADYRSPRRRADIARALLAAVVVLDLVAVWSSLAELDLIERIETEGIYRVDEANRSDDRQAVIGLSRYVLFVLCVVFFLAWFARAYRNIEALGADGLRFSRGWIRCWFIPILIYRPKQIADDIWRGSDPDVPLELQSEWRTRGVHWLLHLWWAAFLLTEVWGLAVRLFFTDDTTITAAKRVDRAYVALDSLDTVAAVLAIVVITMIVRRQETRYDRIRARVTAEPPQALPVESS